MKRWSARQIFVLILAVFLSAGMSQATVQANSMAAKMAMAADMGASGQDSCQGCPQGRANDGMKGLACGTVCIAPILAVLPQAASAPSVQMPVSFPERPLLLTGRTLSPDPYPPRPANLG